MPFSPRLSRRDFVKGMLATPLAAAYSSYASALPQMKITRVETVYWKSRDDAPFWPHWTWVKIDTDAGISGIGETYPRNPVEAAMVHAWPTSLSVVTLATSSGFGPIFIVPLISRSPAAPKSAPERHRPGAMGPARKVTSDAPVYRLIGGKANPRVRLYNTCFPYKYDSTRTGKDHARADRDARHQGHQDLAVRRRRLTQQKRVHQPGRTSSRRSMPVKKLRDTFGDGDRYRHRIPRAVERHLRDPHRPRPGTLQANVARRYVDARQLSAVPRVGGSHLPAADRR